MLRDVAPFEPPQVAVCVCTFRRPKVLDALLRSMEAVVAEVGDTAVVSLVVVDDSPEGEAREVVEHHRATFGGRVTYQVTGARNISTARNKAMEIGTTTADLVACIDDDCTPDESWLRELIDVQQRFDADIVTGRCRDLPAPGAPEWFLNEPWMPEPEPGTNGEVLDIGPLKNSLFRASAVAAAGLRFDEDFGRTGGEDALFFRQAAAHGLRHVHAADAIVEELAPIDRLTTTKQFRRSLWYGNSEARTMLAAGTQGRVRLALSSLKRIAAGPVQLLSRVLRGEPAQWRWRLAGSFTGVGRLLGVLGMRLQHSTINRRRDGSMRRPLRARIGKWSQPEPGMFSVVIPTLQESPLLKELVADYCANVLVSEVIVINNASPTPLPFDHPKLRVLEPGGNIFVNPAWNLGVETSTSDYLIISNDDILLPPGLIEAAASRLGPRCGIIGPHPSCFEEGRSRLRFYRAFDREFAYGTVMFLAKANYLPIPDDLKVWYGDDWLFAQQQHINYGFRGVTITSPMSVTAGQPRFDPVKDADTAAYRTRYAASPYRRRTTLERGIRRRLGRLNR